MPIKLDPGIIDKDTIVQGDCTAPQGHCFGSDGGSGIPDNLKVAPGQGGQKEVWEVDKIKDQIKSKAIYGVCQYCGKYNYQNETDQSPKAIV